MIRCRKILFIAFLVCLLPGSVWATRYTAVTWIDGHPAAADSCVVVMDPEAVFNEFQQELSEAEHAVRNVGLWDGIIVEPNDFKSVDVYVGEDISHVVAALDPTRDAREQMDRLRELPGVAEVWPNWIHYPLWTPNDPYYNYYQGNFKQIYMPAAWDLTKGDGATVAVIDSGYRQYGLEDEVKNLLTGYDFWGNDSNVNDYIGHGTHVSNTIAERTNNGVGCAGIAFNAKIMPLKVFPDYDDGALDSDINSAINYATSHHADVINMSLGGGLYNGSTNTAVNSAYADEIVVVAASGNEGANGVEYPAAYDNVIAVGSCNVHSVGANPQRSSFSNYGSDLELVAPGDEIYQETYDGTYQEVGYFGYGGTSMASPHVAAVAALLVSYGGADASAIRQALRNTARSSYSGWSQYLGYGEIDAYAALVAYGGAAPNQKPTAYVKASPTQGEAPLTVQFDGSSSSDSDGNIVKYIWRNETRDTKIGTGKKINYRFINPGTYLVKLTVTDNDGAADTDSVRITVKEAGDDDTPADDDTSGDDDTPGDDDYGDSECGNLISLIYNTCAYALILDETGAMDPNDAYDQCENGDNADTYECLYWCYEQVTTCDTWQQCAIQACGVQIYQSSGGSGDDDEDNDKDEDDGDDEGGYLWGCGG